MAGQYARSNATGAATTWGAGTSWAGSWDRTLLGNNDSTWTYTGEMYIPTTTVSFQGECDDNLRVKLDGTWLGAAAGNYGSGITPVTPGWHSVQFSYFSTNPGGAGAYTTGNGFIGQNPDVAPYTMGKGFVVDMPGIAGNGADNNSIVPLDSGNGSLFTQALAPSYHQLPQRCGVLHGERHGGRELRRPFPRHTPLEVGGSSGPLLPSPAHEASPFRPR